MLPYAHQSYADLSQQILDRGLQDPTFTAKRGSKPTKGDLLALQQAVGKPTGMPWLLVGAMSMIAAELLVLKEGGICGHAEHSEP